jgi:hypothetical protein
MKTILIVLAAVLVLHAAGGTASASHYNHLLAPLSKCGGSNQTDPTVDTATQERMRLCLHNYAREGRQAKPG